MDKLIPMISQKVIESIKPSLKKMVDVSLLPHFEKIQSAHHVINLQREEIDKQKTHYTDNTRQVGQSRGKG